MTLRTATPVPFATRPGALASAHDAGWNWRVEATMAGEVLVLARRGTEPATSVEVLLDDRAPADLPAVYRAPTTSDDLVPPDGELRCAYVLPLGRRPFRTLRVRWTDAGGRPREARYDVRAATPVRPEGDAPEA